MDDPETNIDDTTVEITHDGQTVRTTHGRIVDAGERLRTAVDVPAKTAFEGITFIDCSEAVELSQALLADLDNKHLTTLRYDAKIADVQFVVTIAAGLLPRSIGQRHLEAMVYHALRRMEFDEETEEPCLALFDYGAGYLDEFEKYGPWNSHMADLSAVTDTEPKQAVMPLPPGAAA